MIPGIYITHVVQPEVGGVFIYHCPVCGRSDIVVVPWGKKPENGDLWLVRGMCMDDPRHTFFEPTTPERYFTGTA